MENLCDRAINELKIEGFLLGFEIRATDNAVAWALERPTEQDEFSWVLHRMVFGRHA